MPHLVKFAEYVSSHKTVMAEEIVNAVIERASLKISDDERENAVVMYKEFLTFLGDIAEQHRTTAPEALINWSKENAAMQVSAGGKISEIIVRYQPTREVFIEVVNEIGEQLNLCIKEQSEIIKKVDLLLDTSLNETVFAYEAMTERMEERYLEETARLSAPIVPVREGVVVLPLIGEMTAFRARYILENVLPELAGSDITHAIIDFSGITPVEIEVAQYLNQMKGMLQLLGIQVLATGFRPDTVKSLVDSGLVDFRNTRAFTTVKQALDSLEKVNI
ncbi:STAS domain-containing protein [Jeotgalibacillus haloalkalitolerans]|uniref:STAS domain-containing protein n=1 Tax=Jeotgalibacillus haloalkalitolerans TaxID=3104292 RepID=A0ABU5KII9_9BACL|nr:STAS domain-containing protein [Jeotgalibacillus sp. HH7-29]MDZ5711064.1 STAS domain-containing protein [Jeotgalibacillus sp. HH7-29]